jgi:hypothetical protein
MLRCHGRANRGLSATSHTRIKGISRHWSPALLTTKRDLTAGLLEVFLHPHVGNCMWPQLQIRIGVNTIQWSSSLESRPLQAWRELADTLQNTDLPSIPCGQNAVNINKLEITPTLPPNGRWTSLSLESCLLHARRDLTGGRQNTDLPPTPFGVNAVNVTPADGCAQVTCVLGSFHGGELITSSATIQHSVAMEI